MYRLGLDIGSSTIKAVMMRDDVIEQAEIVHHYGDLLNGLVEIFTKIKYNDVCKMSVTGSNSRIMEDMLPNKYFLGDIPAIAEGTKFLCPTAKSVIEIGSQSARFITNLDNQTPEFSVNEHCAGGTGSFFEDQMSRLKLNIEDYSTICENAKSIPRLSGRCAVFAKTYIIHRQQEGVDTADILLGLCYAMIRNYKAVIVKNLPVKKDVAFSGGVTKNIGVIRAIKDIFKLADNELIISEYARYSGAVGAAVKSKYEISMKELKSKLDKSNENSNKLHRLKPLKLSDGTKNSEPSITGKIPTEGCVLGIDIGSTSTNLVLIDSDKKLVDFQYLRTGGDSENAVKRGLDSIKKRFGDVKFISVGVTGSGRDRIGKHIGADTIKDEITAQAKAAAFADSEVDTVFEIGGQDSKYISIKNGEVADFQMNKICAAGTGSFVEEQAARMNIPISDFGPMALRAKEPVDLGERCTVFIETAIASAVAQGAKQEDIAAGLCHSIIKNYLHKVVGTKPVGEHIVLQGGVNYNIGIIAAFQSAYGDKVTVSPYFSISGALGVALIALEEIGDKQSTFKGFDNTNIQEKTETENTEIKQNITFYKKTRELLLKNYNPQIDPKKKTVGVPMVLILHKFFPLVNEFFKNLGFNVVVSDYTTEETIRLSQQYAQGETCYPIKLIYGHMAQLIEKKVDYIFLPSIHTMMHEHTQAKYCYGCVYMQTAAKSVADAMKIEEKGIKLLNPVFDLDFGKKAMVMSMLGVGKQLGFIKPVVMKALISGAMAVRKFDSEVEKLGEELISSLDKNSKVLVMITRNYGVNDPVLNMGIPELLLERGYKVITLAHLPGHGIDISEDYPNMYWPFGEHILSGAKIIANHPNLYAIYLTNHGCGPDSMIQHMFKEEMGDKPYLQIEVDEHFSKVGVITRVEAFLNSLEHYETKELSENFDIKNVRKKKANIGFAPKFDKDLYIPDVGYYTDCLVKYFEQIYGIKAKPMKRIASDILALGREETTSKEYLPFPAIVGQVKDTVKKYGEDIQILIPFNQGAEADGQYSRAVKCVLDRMSHDKTMIVSPILERLTENAKDIDCLMRALVLGDMTYLTRNNLIEKYTEIPTWEQLCNIAENTVEKQVTKTITAVGTPMSLTSLDDGVIETLENKGYEILRMSLAEYMWFLLYDNAESRSEKVELTNIWHKIQEVNKSLKNKLFEEYYEDLFDIADKYMYKVSGGNIRYRYAKAVLMSRKTDGVLTFEPRYENASMVIDMRRLADKTDSPVFRVSLDADWDENSWARLESFLYYL